MQCNSIITLQYIQSTHQQIQGQGRIQHFPRKLTGGSLSLIFTQSFHLDVSNHVLLLKKKNTSTLTPELFKGAHPFQNCEGAMVPSLIYNVDPYDLPLRRPLSKYYASKHFVQSIFSIDILSFMFYIFLLRYLTTRITEKNRNMHNAHYTVVYTDTYV